MRGGPTSILHPSLPTDLFIWVCLRFPSGGGKGTNRSWEEKNVPSPPFGVWILSLSIGILPIDRNRFDNGTRFENVGRSGEGEWRHAPIQGERQGLEIHLLSLDRGGPFSRVHLAALGCV